MKLFDHVSELLYDHNCVIIPGFGGFVANFKAAEFNAQSGMVKPSRKMVAFNQNLTENDGLLIQYVAKKLNVSYANAGTRVDEMVRFIKEHLTKYRNFEFRNVGTIYLNKDEKLVFVPYENHNFYVDSFGLPDIKVRPVKTVPVARKTKIRSMPVMESDDSGNRRWTMAGIAATFLLFIGAAYLGYKFSNPFDHGQKYVSTFTEPDSEALGSVLSLSEEKPKINSTKPTKPTNSTNPTNPTNSTNLTNLTNAPNVEYHIVVASLSDANAAREAVSDVKFQLFDTKLIESDQNDNVRISIEHFSTRKFAEQYLEEIKSNNFSQAYILEVHH